MMEKGLANLDVEKPPAKFHWLSNLMDLVESSKDSSCNRAGKGSHGMCPNLYLATETEASPSETVAVQMIQE